MSDDLRKVQEQGRMSSEEHKKLFYKEDLHKESRERLEQAERDLNGHHDRQANEARKKLVEAKENLKPFEQIKVNMKFADKLSERVGKRIENEIKKGNIPRYDIKRDTQMQRWLKR